MISCLSSSVGCRVLAAPSLRRIDADLAGITVFERRNRVENAAATSYGFGGVDALFITAVADLTTAAFVGRPQRAGFVGEVSFTFGFGLIRLVAAGAVAGAILVAVASRGSEALDAGLAARLGRRIVHFVSTGAEEQSPHGASHDR